jgi:hypothetical protein
MCVCASADHTNRYRIANRHADDDSDPVAKDAP